MNWNTNRRRSAKTIAKDLLRTRMVFTTWEIDSRALRDRVEKEFDRSFKIWFDTWMRPGLEEIITKGTREKGGPR